MNNTPIVKWLIEEGTFSEDVTPIVDEIRSQGMIAETTKYRPFESGMYDFYGPDDCVIVLGSISLVKQIQRQKSWIPGTFANFANFDCLTYYAYFGGYLWNNDYSILPLGEVKRRYEELQRRHGSYCNGRLFFRPCGGTKAFTGQELIFDTLDKYESQYGKPELPVLVSQFRDDLRSEYRLFCTENKVIDGSRYYNDQGMYEPAALDVTSEEGRHVVEVTEDILRKVTWRPDKIFSVDVGLTPHGGRTRLIEINSFSCSGWYKTPPQKLVAEAARLALQEWTEMHV